jgi:AAA15 family ATPase/GTPase
VFRADEGKLRAQRMVFRHGKDLNGTTFERAEESDGTRRFMDLVPALLVLVNHNRVFIIDEFDRSLHPQVAHSFIGNFLRYSAGKESQLLVTTHETTLLEQDFLRRDEIWLVEKGRDQSSRLVSLVEYKAPPEGTDLRKDYLNGRFGGVPVIRDFHWLDRRHASGA